MGLFDVIKKVYKDGNAIDHPTTYYQDQKISFWASNYAYKLESGEVVVIFDDITKNKKNEQELNKFKRLFDTSLFGYAIADSSGNLSYVNNYFVRSPVGYDLLLTDFIMPDIDGNELAMLMVQKIKDLEVIICTGHIGSLAKVDDTKRYPTNFLYKPIKKEVLLKTVQKVLNNKN